MRTAQMGQAPTAQNEAQNGNGRQGRRYQDRRDIGLGTVLNRRRHHSRGR
jgi:hypothetical protein